MSADWPRVSLYCDGACEPNPGDGGWAAVLLRDGAEPVELCGAVDDATNNQMELRAALEGLQALAEPHRVLLVSDSQYLINGIERWVPGWSPRPGLFGDVVGGPPPGLPNGELWLALAVEVRRHAVECRWVRGHTGDRWNDRADELAGQMVANRPLPLGDSSAIHLCTAAHGPTADGRGAWAVILRFGTHTKPLSDRVSEASPIRLHLMAATQGLRAIKKPRPVHLYTTSTHLRDGARWAAGWQSRGWRTLEGKEVSHRDLWARLLVEMAPYQVRVHAVDPNALPEPLVEAREMAQAAFEGRVETGR